MIWERVIEILDNGLIFVKLREFGTVWFTACWFFLVVFPRLWESNLMLQSKF